MKKLKVGILSAVAVGAGALMAVPAYADWETGIDSSFTSSTSDLVSMITGTALPILLGVIIGFFVINWTIKKVFGGRK